ncbi:MAG: M48 family metalloprotease [Acidimicrobiales bacterium]
MSIRDVRGYSTGDAEAANAWFLGVLPSLRYVLVSDGLLEKFPADELDAVMCHEIGHGKEHHLAVQLAIPGALLALLAVPVPAVRIIVLAALLGQPFIKGLVSRALERRADDYASRTAGVDATIRALERLAAANEVPRRVGRLAGLAKRHPGIAERVERLRNQAHDRPSDDSAAAVR